jgi:hypothetical protein
VHFTFSVPLARWSCWHDLVEKIYSLRVKESNLLFVDLIIWIFQRLHINNALIVSLSVQVKRFFFICCWIVFCNSDSWFEILHAVCCHVNLRFSNFYVSLEWLFA